VKIEKWTPIRESLTGHESDFEESHSSINRPVEWMAIVVWMTELRALDLRKGK
jgi:hypothetical protein